MCFSDFEMSQISDCDQRRARKEHTCGECGGGIRRGEIYDYYSWLSDGSWSHLKFCDNCKILVAFLYAYERGEGCAEWESWPSIGGGMLNEDLYDRGLVPAVWWDRDLEDSTLPPNHPGQRRVVRYSDLDESMPL